MKAIIDLLLKTKKIEELRRVGWVLMRVKDPETVTEHTFRLSILTTLFAEMMGLNVEKAIKIAIFHDLCEIHSGDITTLLYHPEFRNVKNAKDRKKIEMKWARLSAREKKKIGGLKFRKEKNALEKLIKYLPNKIRHEIFSYWVEYEKGVSKEGRLVRQLNSVETLIQSIEYFGANEKKSGSTWWESTEEIAEDHLVLEFLEVIQEKLYHGKRVKTKKNLEGILDFIMAVGKLKKIPRKGWVLRGVKNPETVAAHSFSMSLMAWLILRSRNLKLHQEKLLKMVLYHELSRVYSEEMTPYDSVLTGRNAKTKKDILKQWVRLSRKEKSETFLRDYRKEKIAIKKLASILDDKRREEIMLLWEEFKAGSSSEGYFLNQIEAVSTLFKSLVYFSEKNSSFVGPFWEWAFESVDNPAIIEFMDELKKKFNKKNLFSAPLVFLSFLQERFNKKIK
ncbi:MAG: HD domain containing 2 [Parcubacteria group bacterium GW2011_GWA1_36_12]|nr:MAG: HD domain containing 2 [Parcubacteria group bacterium GW2011_GWA1_36_12]